MARLLRLIIPDVPHLVVLQGNNHQPCFTSNDDYEFYLDCLFEVTEQHDVMVHAYCLLQDHAIFILNPENKTGIPKTIQQLGRRYVRYFNYKNQRSGTLWEGRYRSCLIESDAYLLKCYQYIEMLPVWFSNNKHPDDYQWSSYQYHINGENLFGITPHTEYLSLGRNKEMRAERYKKLFDHKLSMDEIAKIKEAIHSNRLLGSDNFTYWVENELSMQIRKKKPGRRRNYYVT